MYICHLRSYKTRSARNRRVTQELASVAFPRNPRLTVGCLYEKKKCINCLLKNNARHTHASGEHRGQHFYNASDVAVLFRPDKEVGWFEELGQGPGRAFLLDDSVHHLQKKNQKTKHGTQTNTRPK